MATEKRFEQYFEDFRGVERRKSHLTRDPKAAIAMDNLEILENQSLIGRQGRKVTGQLLYIKGIHTYSYVDTNGLTREEIIAIGGENEAASAHFSGDLFKLVESVTLDITYVAGSTTWDYSMLADTSTGTFKFKINQGGSDYFTSDIGTGLVLNTGSTLKTLADAIDATANFSCSCPKTAVVNGLQTINLSAATLTVDAGHTVSAGDWLFITASNGEKTWFEVVATAATTLTFHAINTLSVTFADNEVIGLGALRAAGLMDLHYPAPSTTSTKSAAMSYWQMVPAIYHVNGSFDESPPFASICASGAAENRDLLPPSFVNYRNCCYMTAAWAKELSYINQINTKETLASASPIISSKYKQGVWRYDGKNFGCSAIPRLTDVLGGVSVAVGAAGALTGTYRYKVSYHMVDFQGNIVDMFYDSFQELALTADRTTVTITLPTYSGTDTMSSNFYNLRGTVTTTTIADTDTYTVPSRHSLRTGDKVFVRAYNPVAGASWEVKVVEVESHTNTQLVFTESFRVNNVSATEDNLGNFLIRLWRTKANGSDYFLCTEYVVDPVDTSYVFTDNNADTALGIPITALAPDYIQSGLPRGNAITVHQGCLTVGGGGTIPKQIAWEDPAYPELTDQAVRQEYMPFTRSGDVTALAGDVGSTLMVFGPSSQFAVRGSLSDAQYEIEKASDTGKGIAGPNCLAFGEEAIYGVGRQGLVRLSYGEHDENFGLSQLPLYLPTGLVTLISSGFEYDFSGSRVFYDELRHRVHFFTPSGTSTAAPSFLASIYLVYDMLNEVWYDFSMASVLMLPSSGFTIKNDKVYTAGWNLSSGTPVGALLKVLSNETTDLAQDYLDNTLSYDWELTPQWDDAGLPKVNKTWHDFVMYMLQPDYFTTAFSVLLRTYRNWDDGTVGSTRTLTFDSSTNYEESCKLNADSKAKRMKFKLTGTVSKNPPVITGYEYTRSSSHFTPDRMAE